MRIVCGSPAVGAVDLPGDAPTGLLGRDELDDVLDLQQAGDGDAPALAATISTPASANAPRHPAGRRAGRLHASASLDRAQRRRRRSGARARRSGRSRTKSTSARR